MVFDQRFPARVWQLVEPLGEFRKEMTNGFDEGLTETYDFACRRRLWVTWVLIKARVN
jgi:hypothetical protein